MKEYEQSVSAFTKSLDHYKNWYEMNILFVARASNNLGGALCQKDFHHAVELYQRALAIQVKYSGKTSRYCYYLQQPRRSMERNGTVPKRHWLLRQHHRHSQRTGGEEQEAIAIAYDNLAGALRERGELQKAQELYMKSIAISQKIFGESHPNIASCYDGLGKLSRIQKQLEQAHKYHQKALEMHITFLEKTDFKPHERMKIWHVFSSQKKNHKKLFPT